MLRRTLSLILLVAPILLLGQTVVDLSNVVVKDGGQEHTGQDQSIALRGDEGSENTVLYADQDLTLRIHFKVSTHNVRRSSMKDSAVNLIMTLYMEAGKKKDKRRTEKIFYMDDARTSSFKERFLIKQGVNNRIIDVSFDAKIK